MSLRKINSTFSFVSFIVLAIFINSCQKENLATRYFPRMNTLEVSDISVAGAIFHGVVISLGDDEIIDHGFAWGEYTRPDINSNESKSLGPRSTTGEYSVSISTSLQENVTYYVRAYAQTNQQVIYGKEVLFVSMGSEQP